MKPFCHVMPGDKIYYILKDKSFRKDVDKYGDQFHDGINFSSIEIKDIRINTNGILFNPRNYRDSLESDIEIPSSISQQSTFETNIRIYFTEESLRDEVMRNMAIGEIKRIERELAQAAIKAEKDIEEIRKNYFSVLNKA